MHTKQKKNVVSSGSGVMVVGNCNELYDCNVLSDCNCNLRITATLIVKVVDNLHSSCPTVTHYSQLQNYCPYPAYSMP